MLSLRKPRKPFQISPCAVTTSSPRHSSRALPKRSTATPPALVERLPPMVHEPSAASDSGNNRPASRAASCTVCKIQPASTVIVLFNASMPRTRFMRASDSTSALPDASGVAAPDMPVLPPCGTIGTPCAAHQRTTIATSSAVSGCATATALPVQRLRQSVTNGAISAASVSRRPEKVWARDSIFIKGVRGLGRRDCISERCFAVSEIGARADTEQAGAEVTSLLLGY